MTETAQLEGLLLAGFQGGKELKHLHIVDSRYEDIPVFYIVCGS